MISVAGTNGSHSTIVLIIKQIIAYDRIVTEQKSQNHIKGAALYKNINKVLRMRYTRYADN
jgi:hypothetical protein